MQSVQPVLQLSNKSGSVGNSPYASPARSHRTLLDDHVGGGSSSGRSDAANASAPDGPTAAADVVGSSVSDAGEDEVTAVMYSWNTLVPVSPLLLSQEVPGVVHVSDTCSAVT